MDQPKGSKLWKGTRPKYVIIGFLLVGAVIGLIAVAVSQYHPSTRNHKYGIVLDAGSSHTNMYIYKWPAEKENDTGVVQQIDVCEVEGPGISGYASDVGNAGPSLKHCMDKAKEVVPERKYRDTPVYLGATAGMRLLRMENASTAKSVLSGVEATLRSYPFNFRGARILSGEEEGAYGWITLNYLLGNLREAIWPSFLPRLFARPGTIGALDLGGASTQITFEPNQDTSGSSEYMLNFHLYGKTYSVYTHSYLCYGKDQALRLKILNNVKGSSTARIQDPCFLKGYERTMNMIDLSKNPCTARSFHPKSFSILHIEGTGDYEQCLAGIEDIFNSSGCPSSSCSFNASFMPPLSGQFGAFSAFYYVMSFLNVTEQPMDEVIKALKAFCSKSWAKVKADYPKIKEKYLSEYCFAGTYVISLLGKRYNFTKEKWSDIRFLGKVRDSDAGWTLGYMLNLTNMINAEQSFLRPLSYICHICLMVVFSVMVVLLVVVGYVIYRKPKCLKKEAI
uniref:Ectonucleoside triphosphate diphosphohydrolase 1 n=1 Tax=Anolis carolinensis TaxID=28377 RepID=G1KCT1_ANOCA|nr:PREDICTED: ectonucleoside triphosphate diphosphohydrolase 1 [Anolis carolinensis]|eukprot:XP_008104704.1 PREDICTED: ectonucleoside triphosphate diphosphohydrolase 1 [Anolis carolinensis]